MQSGWAGHDEMAQRLSGSEPIELADRRQKGSIDPASEGFR